MLINGILFNSEAWHSISQDEIKALESVDEHLLRGLVKGHSKTPLEFLYLEAGVMPIRFILSSRRIMFLQTILKRNHEELTRKVYEQQKINATKGDFYLLVKEDFEMIEKDMNEDEISGTNAKAFKSEIKKKVKIAAFQYLQQSHSKVMNIVYTKVHAESHFLQ